MASLKQFKIDDDLAHAARGAIEVTVTMDDGTSRWCYFMTPTALAAAGDWVPGTQVRFHYGTPHMIVVSELNAEIVDRVLKYLDKSGDLVSCTRELEGAG
jgi:hypothetical protein